MLKQPVIGREGNHRTEYDQVRQRFSAAHAIRKTQMGSEAMSKDASPLGTCVSAQCRVPWPIRKNKNPMTTLARSCGQLGRWPFATAQRSRIVPAVKCRKPAV